MKKYIITILLLCSQCYTLCAQNPTETSFDVNIKTSNGNDSTLTFSSINSNSFSFIGGKGNVQYILPNGIANVPDGIEENVDVYAWLESADYNKAQIIINQSDGEWNNELGLCISTKPSITLLPEDELNTNNSEVFPLYEGNQWNVNLQKFDSPCVFLSFQKNQSTSEPKEILTNGLDYITTYYYRPYVKFQNGMIMYGGEKSFTTPKTIQGALLNEPEIGSWYAYDSQTNYVISEKALNAFYSTYENLLGEKTPIICNVISSVFIDFIGKYTNDIESIFKKSISSTIKCEDGTLNVVDIIPENIQKDFFDYYYNEPIVFSPLHNINFEFDTRGDFIFTKNTIVKSDGAVQAFNQYFCDESWNVPYNSYIDIEPATTSSNPQVGINLSRVPASRPYDIYITLVNPNPDEDPRGCRFYTNIYERITEGEKEGQWPTSGVRMQNPVSGDNYFLTNGKNRVETVYIGTYTFKGVESLIQLQSQVTTRLNTEYTREFRIAEIKLIPKNEE